MKPSTPIVPSTVRNRERDKALVIALAYERMREVPVSPIPTAIDDGLAIYEYLKEQEAYLEKNIVIMTDSCDNPNMTATRENILREIENLMAGMQAGDRRVFYYAGHGCQIVCRHHTEPDNLEEVILTDSNYGMPYDENSKPLNPANVDNLETPSEESFEWHHHRQ